MGRASNFLGSKKGAGAAGDSSIMSKGSQASSSLLGDYNSTTTGGGGGGGDELTSVSQYSVMSEHDISKLESYISKCIEELPVETPDLLFAGRKSTMLLQSLLRIFLFDNEENTGGNSATKAKDMPPGGVMVVFPSQNNEVKQTLLIVRDKDLAKEVAVKCGAIESVIRLMRTFKDSPRYQSKAVELLGILAENIPIHQNLIAREHGISFIIAVLLHPQISKESRICLDAIRSLARICTPSSKAAISQLVEGCDGIHAIDKIIQKHSSSDKFVNMHIEILKILVNVATYSELRPEPSTPTGETTSSIIKTGFSADEDDDDNEDDDGLCYPYLKHLEDPDLIENILKEVISKYSKSNGKPSASSDKINDLAYVLIHKLAYKGKGMGTRNALVRKKAIPVILRNMTKQYDLTKTCALKQLRGLQTLYVCCKERPEARETIISSDEYGIIAILDSMLVSYRTFPLLASTPTLESEQGEESAPVPSSTSTTNKKKRTTTTIVGPDDCLAISIPRKGCQLFNVLLEDDNKKTTKAIAKNLKKDVKYRDMLKDFKATYPNECQETVDKLIDTYNKQYGF